jgi:hypothetical protein
MPTVTGNSNRGLSLVLWTVVAASILGTASGGIELVGTMDALPLESLRLWKRAVLVGIPLSLYALMVGLLWRLARGVWRWERKAGRSGSAPKA